MRTIFLHKRSGPAQGGPAFVATALHGRRRGSVDGDGVLDSDGANRAKGQRVPTTTIRDVGRRRAVLAASIVAIVLALAALTNSFVHGHGERAGASASTGGSAPGHLLAARSSVGAGLDLETAVSRWRVIALVGLAGGGLLIGVLAVTVARERSARRAAHAQLDALNTELDRKLQACLAELATARASVAQMAQKLDEAREEERRRIARDLHDDLSATLVALQIEMSEYSGARAQGGQLRRRRAGADLVDGALDVVHKVVTNLRTSLDPQSTWESIRNKARAYERVTKISCHVEIPQDLPLPPELVANVVYRVVEEALTNVARHSRATRVVIEVASTPQALSAKITDNGRGIDEDQLDTQGSFGVLGMRERADSVGGQLDVRRGQNGGTIVHLHIPHAKAYA